MTLAGFPHSEILGSKDVCSSPRLIAACRVLHRLPMPRHPPCALSIFISVKDRFDTGAESAMRSQRALVHTRFLPTTRKGRSYLRTDHVREPHARTSSVKFLLRCGVDHDVCFSIRGMQEMTLSSMPRAMQMSRCAFKVVTP